MRNYFFLVQIEIYSELESPVTSMNNLKKNKIKGFQLKT